MFYIPVKEENLKKHRVYQDKNITGSLGPIMVNPLYVGNGYQLESYASSIGKKYIFTKAHKDNIYSVNNLRKFGYEIVDEYQNERGNMLAFIKQI